MFTTSNPSRSRSRFLLCSVSASYTRMFWNAACVTVSVSIIAAAKLLLYVVSYKRCHFYFYDNFDKQGPKPFATKRRRCERYFNLGKGKSYGVPLNRALLSSYSLSTVIIPLSVTVWPQILTGSSDPQISPFCEGPGPLSNTVLLGTTRLPVKWHLLPSNGFIRVHECDRRTCTQNTLYGNIC